MISGQTIKKDFPLFKRRINGKPIIYLDSTATSLKPQMVIDAVNTYYTKCTANVYRGIYMISEEATAHYEKGRAIIAEFINSSSVEEIIFTRNATESLNLIAYSFLPYNIRKGDHIVTTVMEHHSNFVPWQQYAVVSGASFDVMKITDDGLLNLADLPKFVTKKTKVFAFTAVSNVLGTINPVKEITRIVKKLNPECLVVVDAAQAVPHMSVDVQDWGADAIAFSGHKMLGPSGIGVLWMKKQYLETMKPFLYGGDMIREVHEKTTLFNDLPHKFEAGTPYIEGVMGLGAAALYLKKLGMKRVRDHEKEITGYALHALSRMPDILVYGPKDPEQRGGVIAFGVNNIHPHDVAQVLDKDNVCVRVGYHCAMPLHEHLGVGATVRASFYVYTDKHDIDMLIVGLEKVKKMFK